MACPRPFAAITARRLRRAPSRGVAAGGVVDEAGHSPGAHPGRTSGTERAARAHASHAEAGDGFAAGGDGARQQRAFDRFRREYNELRPHEALGMQTPAAVYTRSPRVYPGRVREPEYDQAFRCGGCSSKANFAGSRSACF